MHTTGAAGPAAEINTNEKTSPLDEADTRSMNGAR
jgi:hypothetical protein